MQKLHTFAQRAGTRISSLPHLDIAALITAIIAYAALVLSHITTWSIWFDEAFTAYIVRFNYIDIARYTATDVHPPLYYWFVKAWTSIWGTSELAFRSFSLVCGAIAIVLGFILLRKLFGARAAVLGAWFMALSPMLVRYGEEARMYTMVTAIVLGATYVLVRATETNARKYWVWYGILIAAGMWTHYFAALAWLAHWVWRAIALRIDGARGKQWRKRFFSKQWIWTHILAIGIFAVWAPFMLRQLGIVQMGFWIPAVSAHSFTNYFTNVLFYLEQQKTVSWLALLYMTIITLVAVLLYRAYRQLSTKRERKSLILLMALAFVPPILLFISSMPPMKSSFIERYLVPAAAGLMLLLAAIVAHGIRGKSRRLSVILAVLLITAFAIGINRVYYYGNYNKNSDISIRAKELVAAVSQKAKPGEPLIAADVWGFYEAVFYTTKDHPIYFLDETADYKFGSTDMLKYSDQFKIKDLNSFIKDHPTVWYLGYDKDEQLTPPSISHGWRQIDSVAAYDPISGTASFKAVRYQTSAE